MARSSKMSTQNNLDVGPPISGTLLLLQSVHSCPHLGKHLKLRINPGVNPIKLLWPKLHPN